MVIDTSALAAILFLEPERVEFLGKMAVAPSRLVSAATLVELSVVLLRRSLHEIEHGLTTFMERSSIRIVPVDEAQAAIARRAFRDFGKGKHPANLNFGDCFSYSLAKKTDEPLLFKGNDFSRTDVRRA